MKTGKLNRTILAVENRYLSKDIPIGKVVYEYVGYTYGCISSGVAVSDKPGQTPFYEVPIGSVDWDRGIISSSREI